MKIEIEIPDEKIACLTDSAREELAKATTHYVERVLDEAGRIEASRNASKGKPEITGSIISNAVVVTGIFTPARKRSVWTILIQILASISTLLTGGLWDTSEFHKNNLYFVMFVLILIVAVISSVYLIIRDRND